MKKALLIIGTIISIGVNAQTTAIPDANFEQALINLGIDTDGANGQILNSDASGVTTLSVENQNINDLTGIEAFTSITYLSCFDNNLSSLDLSNNSSLINFSAYNNQITSLNIGGLVLLENVDVSWNSLSSLDFTSHPALTGLYCYQNNLTSLTIQNNVNLTEFSCGNNQLSGLLDVSAMPNLTFFSCSDNQITQIVLGNHPSLYGIACFGNQITSLDCSGLPVLEELFCGQNQLTSLSVQNGYNNYFTAFNSVGNPSLSCIEVDAPSYSNSATATWTKDATSSYALNCTTGLNDQSQTDLNNIKLSPNPTKGNFSLELNETCNTGTITITDLNGKLIQSKTYNESQLLNLTLEEPAGVYLLRIESGEKKALSRLVKE
ncbi:MAG: T9SS type A sorting domain-containing protein [Crocinitomicaceae bacterium]|nr:T9SS type A sorting domain-containing protein [Crocinitomicaceae bacterium]